ncbi:MAG: hypothetical protein WD512_03135 [Candidatus Paceibacterota bacterium]
MIPFTKEWVNSVNKTINSNGCWIPSLIPLKDGYVSVTINNLRYKLHRVALCVYYNIEYHNLKIETRHSSFCVNSCFNPEHLKPGTTKENNQDMIKDGNHNNLKKTHCSSCGGDYSVRTIKTGPSRGRVYRYCKVCQHKGRRLKL